MRIDGLEQQIGVDAAGFSFLHQVLTIDKTANTLKVRLVLTEVEDILQQEGLL